MYELTVHNCFCFCASIFFFVWCLGLTWNNLWYFPHIFQRCVTLGQKNSRACFLVINLSSERSYFPARTIALAGPNRVHWQRLSSWWHLQCFSAFSAELDGMNVPRSRISGYSIDGTQEGKGAKSVVKSTGIPMEPMGGSGTIYDYSAKMVNSPFFVSFYLTPKEGISILCVRFY